jgi:hypothetical protein
MVIRLHALRENYGSSSPNTPHSPLEYPSKAGGYYFWGVSCALLRIQQSSTTIITFTVHLENGGTERLSNLLRMEQQRHGIAGIQPVAWLQACSQLLYILLLQEDIFTSYLPQALLPFLNLYITLFSVCLTSPFPLLHFTWTAFNSTTALLYLNYKKCSFKIGLWIGESFCSILKDSCPIWSELHENIANMHIQEHVASTALNGRMKGQRLKGEVLRVSIYALYMSYT